MNVQPSDEIIDLGAIQIETCGISPIGFDEVETGMKYIATGIQDE